jgi:hypothetical protein
MNVSSLGWSTSLSVDEATRNDRLTVADLMIQSQGGRTRKYFGLDSDIEDDITHVILDEAHPHGILRISEALTG